MIIDRIAILGVGLIGGSLARSLRAADVCNTIVGYGRNVDNLKKAVELRVIDEFSESAAEACREADLVVIASPLSTYPLLFKEISSSLKQEAVITDVGSAKACVVDAARQYLPDHRSNFIAGHPIAGKEKSGVEASSADLFSEHLVILTPDENSSVHALSVVTQMWEVTGAEVVSLSVEDHDAILAATSHLPHLLAYALVDCLAKMEESTEIFRFAAGGFIDFTRIASSNPKMWHDICYSNRESVLKVLDDFNQHLGAIRSAIEGGDSDVLLDIFTKAKNSRDDFITERALSNVKTSPE